MVNPIYQNKIAGLHTCRNFTLDREDKLIGGIPTKDNNLFTFSLAISWAQILAFAQTSTLIQAPALAQALTPAYVFAPAQASALAPGPLCIYINVHLHKTIRLALELFVKGEKYEKANFAPL